MELFGKRGASLLQASRPQEESHGDCHCQKERGRDQANGHPNGARHRGKSEDYPEQADYQSNQNGVEDQIQSKLDPEERDASPDENTGPEQAQHAFYPGRWRLRLRLLLLQLLRIRCLLLL